MRRAPKQLRMGSKDARTETPASEAAIVAALRQAVTDRSAYGRSASENDVKNACIEHLIYRGFLVIRVNQGAITQTDAQTGKRRHFKFATYYGLGIDPQSAGISDILALDPTGRLWAIECKALGKLANMTKAQADFQAEVSSRGGVALCVDDPDLLIEAIDEALPTL